MINLNLEGLQNQEVRLSDGTKGDFVWDDPAIPSNYCQPNCRFQSYFHDGFEIPKLKVKDGMVINSVHGTESYKIRLM